MFINGETIFITDDTIMALFITDDKIMAFVTNAFTNISD